MFKSERPIRQLTKAAVKIFVDRPSPDHPVIGHKIRDIRIRYAKANIYIRMGEHPFKHRGIAIGGHRLMTICKIAIIRVGTRRDARSDGAI